MRLFTFSILLIAQTAFSQGTTHLKPIGPNPTAFAKFTIQSSLKRPIPTKSQPLALSNQLTLTRYYKQHFLLTDTTKANAIWFSLIVGYDGKNFWMAGDTDYDDDFKDEIPQCLALPLGFNQSNFGDLVKGSELRFESSSYKINDTILHPAFSIFVTPVFSHLSQERNVDSIVVYPSLAAGYKSYSSISIEKDSLLLVLQMHPLITQFPLFEYYNVKHQQSSYFNLMNVDSSTGEKLISYMNAHDLLVKRKSWHIEQKEIGLHVQEVDYANSILRTAQEPMTMTESESSIKSCKTLVAKSITTDNPFQFSENDSLILYFTGSWCAPCRELTPLVEKYFENLPKGWKGVVIANEKSLSIAATYLQKFKFQHTYFEPLDDKTHCSLKKIFSVGVYPTMVYITPQGRVLWSGQHIRN